MTETTTKIDDTTIALAIAAKAAAEALKQNLLAVCNNGADDCDSEYCKHALYSNAIDADISLSRVLAPLLRLAGPAPTVDW